MSIIFIQIIQTDKPEQDPDQTLLNAVSDQGLQFASIHSPVLYYRHTVAGVNLYCSNFRKTR